MNMADVAVVVSWTTPSLPPARTRAAQIIATRQTHLSCVLTALSWTAPSFLQKKKNATCTEVCEGDECGGPFGVVSVAGALCKFALRVQLQFSEGDTSTVDEDGEISFLGGTSQVHWADGVLPLAITVLVLLGNPIAVEEQDLHKRCAVAGSEAFSDCRLSSPN